MTDKFADYSLSEQEIEELTFENNSFIIYDYFLNTVSFDTENKTMFIGVDGSREHHVMKPLVDQFELDEFHQTGRTDDVLTEEDIADAEAMRLSALDTELEIFNKMSERYHFRLDKYHHKRNLYYQNSKEKLQPKNNVLSGAVMNLQLGQGILEFIYADFSAVSRKTLALCNVLFNANLDGGEEYFCKNDVVVDEYLKFSYTMSSIDKVAYTTLYSAVCPPVFVKERGDYTALRYYLNYISKIQKEYRELFEFCYDENFYPEVLSQIPPAERYFMYKHLHGQSVKKSRTEIFDLPHMEMSGTKYPYGLTKNELAKRMGTCGELTDNHIDFADKYDIAPDKLKALLNLPHFVSVKYEFSTIKDLLELEFTKMLELNIRFRKCKRCNRYFIMKGNYDTNYCDRVAEGETRNCQELSAQENYKNKIADNKAIPLYSKFYKRYSARVKVNQIKESDFKKWKYQAITMRDKCSDGEISVDEFEQWLTDSFPNRTPKK